MRKTNEQSVKEVLKELLDAYRLKSRLDETRIRDAWAKVMGPTIARYTQELRLRRGKLTVVISSAVLRQELHFGRDKIQTNMNEALGEALIKDVEVR